MSQTRTINIDRVDYASLQGEESVVENDSEELDESPQKRTRSHEVQSQETVSEGGIQEKTRKKRSFVWNHFHNIESENGTIVICNYCNKSFDKRRIQSSTTNLASHLKTHEIHRPTKSKEITNIKTFEEALVDWVISTNQRFTCIENPAFVELIRTAGVELPIKSAATLKLRINNKFQRRKSVLIESIRSTSTISISLDIWTSPTSNSFMAIIGHWITGDFEYKEQVLDFVPVVGQHTGENLAQLLFHCLEDYECSDKLLSITCDNASNNGSLLDNLIELLPWGSRLKECGYIRCLAHILNLIVQTVLTELKSGDIKSAEDICDHRLSIPESNFSVINRIRVVAVHSTRTPQRRELWRQICAQNNKVYCVIAYDVPTRWNSTYRMLTTAVKYRSQYERYISRLKELENMLLDDNDWKFVDDLILVLEQFATFTEKVSESASSQITLSLPIYYCIQDILLDVKDRKKSFKNIDDKIVKAVESGLQHFEKYYNIMDGNDTYFIATVLHPKYKGSWLAKQLGEPGPDVVKHIQNTLENSYPADENQPPVSSQYDGNDLETLMSLEMNELNTTRSDIEEYFCSKPVAAPSQTKFDVLQWWKNNEAYYPRMSKVAREYLAIPSSSVSVERLFSTGRDVVGIRRYSMHAETLRMIMSLKLD